MSPDEFTDLLWSERATAILRTDDQRRAAEAMDAAVRGGFRVIEFTLSVPGVYELIEEFSDRDDLVVGAGTVLRPEEAERAVGAGAAFIVSPVTDESVVHAARDLGVAAMPGAHTATELHRAWRAGAPLQKLFPAPANGPAWVRMLLGPLPFLRLVPTSGVDPENAGEWFAAGVWAVGFVRSLFVPEDIAQERWDSLEARARRCLTAARSFDRPEEAPQRRAAR